MRRLVLEEAPQEGRIQLGGRNFRYLVRVLRFKEGDSFRALLPGGEEVLCTIERIGPTSLWARVSSPPSGSPLAPPGGEEAMTAGAENTATVSSLKPAMVRALQSDAKRLGRSRSERLVLCQALPKGSKMDTIIRQATEWGVDEIIPFTSEHSIPRFSAEKDVQNRSRRWQQIIIEAQQQSGSFVSTSCKALTDVAGLCDIILERKGKNPRTCALLFHQDAEEVAFLHHLVADTVEEVILIVGPEGGFSPPEVAQFKKAGCVPVVIGATVLRVETAAISALAAVSVILMEKHSWLPLKN
ncbi:MAG: 16S rRNA (uracil(1498)-N(3))-methyltransferase [Treponemataceae bacterium]|nr:16S rRNA (uracil(1498)-N(3))-methyltransferase [Treponemataceae bacterium]